MNHEYKIICGYPADPDIINEMTGQLNQWAAEGWRVVSSVMRSDDLWLVILENTKQDNEWLKIGMTMDERRAAKELEGK